MKKARIFHFWSLSLALLWASCALSQGVIPTKGTDFWLGYMSNFQASTEPELSIFVVAEQNTSGVASIPGLGVDIPFSVAANSTTTVILPDACEHDASEVIENLGIHVTTNDTVSVFAINFKALTADGTKILPVESTGTDYTISAYSGRPGTDNLVSEFLIVSTEDGTEVEITPTAPTNGGQPANVPFTISLDQGQSYQVKASVGEDDFMGTRIVATESSGSCRPFAVFSGSNCANVPSACQACDHIYEQNFPTSTWGEEFFVVPFDLIGSCTYRVMAKDNGTQIFRDGLFEGALNAGQFLEFNAVEDEACISASGPVSVTQYMEGVQCVNNFSDPAMLILNDSDQKIDNVTFSTVVSPNISQHSITVIVESSAVGTVTLDNTIIDPALFTAFPNCLDHSFAKFPIAEGSHTLISSSGFTAYVYGLGAAESYAYSVGSFAQEDLLDVVNSQVCTTTDATLQAPTGFVDVYWYAQNDPETILSNTETLNLAAPVVSDVYVAVGLDAAGCPEETLYLVESEEGLLVDIDPSATSICRYESVQLTTSVTPESEVYTYTWTPAIDIDNASSANPIITPLESRWYYVNVAGPTGCGFGQDSIFVDVSPGNASGLVVTAEPEVLCVGEQTTLTANIEQVVFEDNFDPNISLGIWSEVNNATASQDCGSVGGEALYFDGNGDRSITTQDLDLSAGGSVHFSLKIGSETAPCDDADPGENVVLEYSTNGGADWTLLQLMIESDFEEFTTLNLPIPTGAQTAATRLRWRQTANSGAGEDNWALDNVFIGVFDPSQFTFNWLPAGQTVSPNDPETLASPLVSTIYTVEVSDNVFGCTYTQDVEVVVGQPFGLAITEDQTLCDADGILLEVTPDAAGEYAYEWTDVGNSLSALYAASTLATPTSTSTYEVLVTSEEGCSQSASVDITVNELFDLEITSDLTSFCAGLEAQLNATVNGDQPTTLSYSWTPAADLSDSTIPNPTASPMESVTYVLTVDDVATGCQLTDSIALEVTPSFTLDLGNNQELCSTNGHVFAPVVSTTDPLVWEWQPAELLENAAIENAVINMDTTATYIATATDLEGCMAIDSVEISFTFNTLNLGVDTVLCNGASLDLATGFLGEDHLWNTTETTETITVNTAGIYWVDVSNAIGCTARDSIVITVSTNPVIELGNDTTVCEGISLLLDPMGDPLHTFEWNTTESTPTVEVTSDGSFSVEVSNADGCISQDTIAVTFVTPPSLNLPEETTICTGESVVLDATIANGTYLWNTTSTDPSITVSTAGIYWVDISAGGSCTARDSTEVFVVLAPNPMLNPLYESCEGESFLLNPQVPSEGSSFVWTGGSVDSTLVVFESGIYSVEVSNAGCSATAQTQVDFKESPERPFTSNLQWCFGIDGAVLALDAENEGSTYLWSTGTMEQTLNVTEFGDYSVLITNPTGCESFYPISVSEYCYNNQLFVPNAFTPDGDGLNDAFFVVGNGVVDFYMQILDRWGAVVFETDDINAAWVGDVRTGDHYNDNNIYTYNITFTVESESEGISAPKKISGFVTLVR